MRFKLIILTISLLAAAALVSQAAINLEQSECMKEAIAARENLLIQQYAKQADAELAAYDIKKNTLKAAWEVKDKNQRLHVLTEANNSFSTSIRTAVSALRISIDEIQQNYEEARELCKVSPSEDD